MIHQVSHGGNHHSHKVRSSRLGVLNIGMGGGLEELGRARETQEPELSEQIDGVV